MLVSEPSGLASAAENIGKENALRWDYLLEKQ